jgi:D-isomer specific 2-hydroxyacid dehydrogenase, NAD binding domain
MKRGTVLINVSRGGLVNTEALIDGLESGQLGGVGMDVYQVLRCDSLRTAHQLRKCSYVPISRWGHVTIGISPGAQSSSRTGDRARCCRKHFGRHMYEQTESEPGGPSFGALG